MLITEKVKIKVNCNNIKNLTNNGYENLKYNEVLEIDTNHLSPGSHCVVKINCDVCGRERDIIYKEYIRSIKNGGIYTCQGVCSSEKIKRTCLEKYGVDNPKKSEEFKNKAEKTSLEKYGTNHYSSTNESKDRVKITCLEKYGVDNPSKSEDIKLKRENTMLEIHGVKYYVLSSEFKEKYEKTSLKNFGFIHPMMSSKQVEKVLKSKGLCFETNEYKTYQNKVYNLTKGNKEELLKNWDGTDYYDKEYIKDNFKLNGLSSDYPTIDHKISISEGYRNNLTPEELSKIGNLCITKRKINSSKSNKSNYVYNGQ